MKKHNYFAKNYTPSNKKKKGGNGKGCEVSS